MLESVLTVCAQMWIAGGYALEIAAPFVLSQHIRQTRRDLPRAVDLQGISADYLLLSAQSCVYRLIYIFAYVFPSSLLAQQYSARYYLAPDINKFRILSALPYCLSTLAALALIMLPRFTSVSLQLRLRFSTIAKFVSGTAFTATMAIYLLATRVKFDPATGMGFWGLFYIDAVDSLKGVADCLDCVRFWPQVVINWEEGNTVAFDTTYLHALLASAACRGMGMLLAALAQDDMRLATRPAGTFFYVIYITLLCGVFYYQSYWVYRRENARIIRGFTKRAEEDGNEDMNRRAREEETIGLMPLG
ncbi:hypothetical protein V1509DRAFT_635049 [Lipomyces kononenkoae]